MPFHQLPPELLYTILSHLDAGSLRTCALTCRAFVSPAQAHFFHTLEFYSECLNTLAKLETTPHIRTLTRHLRLVEIHRPWIQRSQVLHRTLDILSPYVVSLDILQRTRKPEKPRFDFSSLSRLKCLETISLREEELGTPRSMHGDNALPTFLNHFPKLRAISFECCLVANQTLDSNSDVPPPIFQLESLNVGFCGDTCVLDWLVPALSSLQTLRLSYPVVDSPHFSVTVPQFLITAGTSLQHLEVTSLEKVSNSDLQSLMTVVRTHTTNLRSLSLIDISSRTGHSQIQVVLQSLLLIGAHTHLQHLAIGYLQNDTPLDAGPWNDLQDLLLGTCFPALRSVEFRLSWGSPEPFIAAVPRLAKTLSISVH